MPTLITILVAVLLVACVLWVVSLVPMDGKAKQVLQVVVAVALVLFLIALLLGYVPRVHAQDGAGDRGWTRSYCLDR